MAWFDDSEVVSDDVLELAKRYCELGADEIIVFDLSKDDEEHDQSIDIMKKINRVIHVPMIAGGNIKRQEDVKKILYAGAKKAILNFAKTGSQELIEEVSKRFGKEKIAVSFSDMNALTEYKELLKDFVSEGVFIQTSGKTVSASIPTVVLAETMDNEELFEILKCEGVKGVSGKKISQPEFCIATFKEACLAEGISMNALTSQMDFSAFKLNSDGLIPVIVQDYKTNDVLMLAYMDQDAYEYTIRTGKMTYYSRSRKERWVKGETSGHYQYVKSLRLDCDNDTILAKVDQVGVACHTGAASCFFQTLVADESQEMNPLEVFESVYATILDRKKNPKEGSYTNYLFNKGIDKILKKVGEEATELVIAAKNPNPEEIKYELSDFLYHAMVLMVEKGVTWEDIVQELADR